MSQTNHLEPHVQCSTLPTDTTNTEYLWLEMRVDGQELVSFTTYAVDLEELTRSLHSNGEFFILTCWCGTPECTGIEQDIYVGHVGEVVYWKAIQPKPFHFAFEMTQYDAAIRQVIKQAKQLLAEAKYTKRKAPDIVPMQNEPYFQLN